MNGPSPASLARHPQVHLLPRAQRGHRRPRHLRTLLVRRGRAGEHLRGGRARRRAADGRAHPEGRSTAVRAGLLHGIADAWCAITGDAKESLAIFLHEVPGANVMEDGVILPEITDEPGAVY